MNKTTKTTLYRTIKRLGLENFFVHALDQTRHQSRLHRQILKLTPHPYAYAPHEARSVVRHSLKWQLEPANYFQWHQFYGLRDRVLETLLRLSQDARVFVDVGANIGFYSCVLAARAKQTIKVFSFEPNPETHAALVRHCTLNNLTNVVCAQTALGAEKSEAVLHDMAAGDLGKFSLRGSSGSGPRVDVDTLDSMVARLGIERVDLLKIDVEGFEPEVLAGAQKTIQRDWPALCLELTPEWTSHRHGLLKEMFESWSSGPYRFFSIESDSYVPFSFEHFLEGKLNTRPQYNLVGVNERQSRRLFESGALSRAISYRSRVFHTDSSRLESVSPSGQ
ncbi:MAG: FkbM family methyltransferase [Deltaproteobacteria bacterium]|nr:FkbM family methyltransferase [Deltaproteobacteria bacterium]